MQYYHQTHTDTAQEHTEKKKQKKNWKKSTPCVTEMQCRRKWRFNRQKKIFNTNHYKKYSEDTRWHVLMNE